MVQVVHYPLFSKVGEAGFTAYEAAHTRLISYIVGPPMLVEGVCALILLFAPPDGLDRWLPLVAGLVRGRRVISQKLPQLLELGGLEDQ